MGRPAVASSSAPSLAACTRAGRYSSRKAWSGKSSFFSACRCTSPHVIIITPFPFTIAHALRLFRLSFALFPGSKKAGAVGHSHNAGHLSGILLFSSHRLRRSPFGRWFFKTPPASFPQPKEWPEAVTRHQPWPGCGSVSPRRYAWISGLSTGQSAAGAWPGPSAIAKAWPGSIRPFF